MTECIKKWDDVKNALLAYMEEYGEIYVGTEAGGMFIDSTSDFNEIGEIVMPY